MNILIVDDDEAARERTCALLGAVPGASADGVVSGPAALDRLAAWRYDAVVTSLHMQPMDGIELLKRIRRRESALPVIVLTRDASLDMAVEAMRAGATDFLPHSAETELLHRLGAFRGGVQGPEPGGRGSARARDAEEGRVTAREFLIGSHPLMEAVRRFAERVARVPDARVLITGESGTGKSYLARAIHELAGTGGRFVPVSCATLPPSLVESELFGHEKGAFTDARAMKKGLVELANGGTLFLDEIGALPLEMQTKLLVFLESRQIRRVGGNEAIAANARVVAATNEDLQEAVRAGRFRHDLLYRLDVASITMPPLRDMPGVVEELAVRFTREIAAQFRRPAPQLTPGSLTRLRSCAWPGNARELRNVLERAIIFHDDGPLEVEPPAQDSREAADPGGLLIPRGLTLEEVERRYIADALSAHEGDYTSLSARLGISRKTLWDKRRRYGLDAPNGADVRSNPERSER